MKVEFTALSPIAHGEFSEGADKGNIVSFRRQPVITGGAIAHVPCISGNEIRALMRRFLTRELCGRLNLAEELGDVIFDKFYLAVGCGGYLKKNLDIQVKPAMLREIRTAFPILSVFGATLYKFVMSGMFNVGFAMLKCAETGTGELPIYDLTADIAMVRMPDKEIADVGDSKPMPYTTECVVKGAEFEFDISFAPQATDVEKACVYHGLNNLKKVGGKGNVGFGKIAVKEEYDADLYLEWLDAMADDPEPFITAAKDLFEGL